MPVPQTKGLTFTSVGPDQDLTIAVPDSPADAPPAFVMRKVVRFAIYGVTGVGVAGGE